ncbi:hypothetical protein YC2023_091600 [Brassica napus]
MATYRTRGVSVDAISDPSPYRSSLATDLQETAAKTKIWVSSPSLAIFVANKFSYENLFISPVIGEQNLLKIR